MSECEDRISRVRIADAWKLWTNVVAAFAEGRSAWRCSPQEYEQLYQDLLAMCRLRADEAPEDLFRQMEALVQPWVSLQTLQHGDPIILSDVVDRGRQFQQHLGPKPWLPGMRLELSTVALFMVVAGAALVVALAVPSREPLVELGERCVRAIRTFGTQWTNDIWLGFVALVVTLAAIHLAWRGIRS